MGPDQSHQLPQLGPELWPEVEKSSFDGGKEDQSLGMPYLLTYRKEVI